MKYLKSLKNENIILFVDAGFRVCLLGHKEKGDKHTDFDLPGKIPPFGFTKLPFNPRPDLKKFPHNYGVVLDPDHLVIDVDPRNFPKGRDSWKELQLDLCINLTKLCKCVVKTGGGGWHYYFKKPRKLLVTNELDAYRGVEFKAHGRQVVGPGSIHPDTYQPYKLVSGGPGMLVDAPEDLLDLIRKQDVKLEEGLTEYDDSDTNMILTRQVLEGHPPAIEGQHGDETTYQAAALCRDNGVSPEVALELLEEYNARCEPPWSIDDLALKVKNAYRYGQNAIGSKSAKNDFEGIEATDEKPDAINDKADSKPSTEPTAQPDFLDEIEEHWCFSIGTKTFIDLRDLSEYDKEQFDDIHAGRTDRKKPSAFAISYNKMVKVKAPTYWPGQGYFVEEDGKLRVNLYRRPPLEAKKGNIDPYLEFINYIFGPDKAWILHDFVSYLLRNPGDKVLWAILLQGGFGIGKSLIARTLRSLFGASNVVQPTNSQVHEKYTGWMKSCQLVVVHELMAMGRLEMMNKLKDPITEPTIQVREMFRPAYEINNRANFLFLTNHEDSIVIPEKDRRIVVAFSPAEPREPEYYERYVAWMEQGTSALLHYYLHDHVYDVRFKPKAPAFMTAEKQKMINITRHPVEASIMDMVEDEAPPFHGRLVDISGVLDALKRDHKYLNYMSLAIHMKNCGFQAMTDRLRLKDGRRVRLWAKADRAKMLERESVEKLRDIFDKQEDDYENKEVGKSVQKEFSR